MTRRALALATLLMTAAFVSRPASAADLGTPDRQSLSPQLGSEPPSATMPLNFEALVDSYASVTYRPDGTTKITPASPALRELLWREYESAKI